MRRKSLQVAGDEATEEFYQGDGRARCWGADHGSG